MTAKVIPLMRTSLLEDGTTIHAIVVCEVERMKRWLDAELAKTDSVCQEELGRQCFLLQDIRRVLEEFIEELANLRAAPSTNALEHLAVHGVMVTGRIGILCGLTKEEREDPVRRIYDLVHKHTRPQERKLA